MEDFNAQKPEVGAGNLDGVNFTWWTSVMAIKLLQLALNCSWRKKNLLDGLQFCNAGPRYTDMLTKSELPKMSNANGLRCMIGVKPIECVINSSVYCRIQFDGKYATMSSKKSQMTSMFVLKIMKISSVLR